MPITYDVPQREEYAQPSAAFGATTDNFYHMGPKGKKGLVRDMEADITADMVGTTSVPEIKVGTATADHTYARFRLGTTATAGYTTAQGVRRATVVANGARATSSAGEVTPDVYEDYTGHVKMNTAFIPADTQFCISRVLGVGGVPAGTAKTKVIIDWF